MARRAGAGWGRAGGDPAEGGQRSQRAHLWQINLVVLDERCAAVCRNQPQFNYRVNFICSIPLIWKKL